MAGSAGAGSLPPSDGGMPGDGNTGEPGASGGYTAQGSGRDPRSEGTASGATASGPGYPGTGDAAMTAEESVAVLDEQLDASLAVFDGMILTERRAAQAMETGADGSGSGDGTMAEGGDVAAGGGPLFEEADLSEPAGSGEDEVTVPPMPEGEPGGSNTVAGTGGTGHGRIPADIDDGSDDDIVARQIREAAINEPDPELREKLWDEYRKYKKGQ